MTILWNHDLVSPLFWARCVLCRENLRGPFPTLAQAQGPGTSVCDACSREQNSTLREAIAAHALAR